MLPINDRNILFTVDQPVFQSHGGGLAFGKDGFLYIGLGDAAVAADPLGTGKYEYAPGKMLRIDVDSAHAPWVELRDSSGNPFHQRRPRGKSGCSVCAIHSLFV